MLLKALKCERLARDTRGRVGDVRDLGEAAGAKRGDEKQSVSGKLFWSLSGRRKTLVRFFHGVSLCCPQGEESNGRSAVKMTFQAPLGQGYPPVRRLKSGYSKSNPYLAALSSTSYS